VIPFLRKPPGEDPAVYRAMFDQANDARLVLDNHSIVLHANPTAARLFGAAENALYGVPFSELLMPPSRPAFLRALATIQKPPARAGPIPLDGRFSDGSDFPIEIELFHGTVERFGVVVHRRTGGPPGGPSTRGRFNPAQVLIASRIQELV
jgi:PAS domain S-box-containing protein